MAGQLDIGRILAFRQFVENMARAGAPSMKAIALSGWSRAAMVAGMPAFEFAD